MWASTCGAVAWARGFFFMKHCSIMFSMDDAISLFCAALCILCRPMPWTTRPCWPLRSQ